MNATLASNYTVSADSYPATTQAFRIGALDAQLGDVACPELYFRNPTQKRAYCEGYKSIAGDTLTTKQILGEVAQ